MPKYRISDFTIDVHAPEWILQEYFRSFLCDDTETDLSCDIVFKKCPPLPAEQASLIFTAEGRSIYQVGEFIHIKMESDYFIPSYVIAASDWSKCTVYIDPRFEAPIDTSTRNYVLGSVYNLLRDVVIAALALHKGLMIHSCSILWKDRGVLFSARSGTGKTTHANLWKQRYGVQVLDGDVTACRLIGGRFFTYGLPWFGTSGEFLNRSVPLEAIVFLQQDKTNSIRRLDREEAFVRLAARCFMPRWSGGLTDATLDTIQSMVERTDCYLLKCLPDFEAVELVKNCLEKR